ncbi:unnamed protein product, partial [Tetraodon nigroviridis]
KGRKVTIWEIINSEYITEEQRIELIRQYQLGHVTIEELIKIVITMVDEKADTAEKEICFEGLRALVPAKSLLDSKIIDTDTFDQLQKGSKTPQEVSKTDKVQRYLQGTDRIDGITMTDSNEKLSIYQAMKDTVLQQNTGLALLEAQAATGFLVDPVRNLKFSVDNAVKNGVVGPELHEKLLSAEKSVTGYKDPYTGNSISLFQAMSKDLVHSDHAIPLLEAQFSTGGIIDPVSSHRIPNDVAIQRGLLSQQMSQAFCDHSDKIKSFTNPKTNERVTYHQLVGKCVRDPTSGLCFLPLSKAECPALAKKCYQYTEEQAQTDLAETQIDFPQTTEKPMTIWEVLNSNMLPEAERSRLLEQYRLGKITKERMVIIILEIREQQEILKSQQIMTCDIIGRKVS